MPTADELRAKAARSLSLASQVADAVAAVALRKLAADCLEQAADLERMQTPAPAESAPQGAQQQQRPQPKKDDEDA